MTNNQEIKYILSIQIRHDCKRKTLTLSQDKYTHNTLNKFNMLTSNPVRTPLEAGIRYSHSRNEHHTTDELKLI